MLKISLMFGCGILEHLWPLIFTMVTPRCKNGFFIYLRDCEAPRKILWQSKFYCRGDDRKCMQLSCRSFYRPPSHVTEKLISRGWVGGNCFVDSVHWLSERFASFILVMALSRQVSLVNPEAENIRVSTCSEANLSQFKLNINLFQKTVFANEPT